jgi:endonuclease G
MAPRRDDERFDSADAQSLLNTFSRLDPRMRFIVIVLLIAAAIAFSVAYLRYQRHPGSPSVGSPQMLLGNPSNATDDPSNHDNYLMVKPYFVIGFNDSKGIPNWVSWRVTTADLGNAPRKQIFDPDTTLPPGFYQVKQHDYNGSGFDRGHMCPHSDRAATQEMSFATFVMTNIIPQAPNVNRKAWEQLESYCRSLVSAGNRLYIIAGPAGQGGRGSNGPREVIHTRIVVPAECWKIIVVLPDAGADDLAGISMGTRVITVIMPNDQDKVGEAWDIFRTSPAEVERHTGLHFFDRVRPDVAEALRQKVDREHIAPPRPHHYAE